MASNELAAILARRRAKAGGDADEQPAPAIEKSSAPEPPAPAQPRGSIAERIARLKAQGASAAGGGNGVDFSASAPVPRAVPIFVPPQPQRAASDDGVTPAGEPSASSEEPEPDHRRTTAERIQRLQGSFGAINVNPFGAPCVSSTL